MRCDSTLLPRGLRSDDDPLAVFNLLDSKQRNLGAIRGAVIVASLFMASIIVMCTSGHRISVLKQICGNPGRGAATPVSDRAGDVAQRNVIAYRPAGNVAGYYRETNPMTSLGHVAASPNLPVSKAITVCLATSG
ncbi:hypothetical protein [Nocardia sp. 348MFTsu5.1]|uniref:hypothetical protein n=1 Tax=Nocardia sp. 348MFTsu5.1 TaxID=1172185 RepID=UPI000372EDFC|nr:hypothetical protein [Nocardia sp. 348MFTsu5.1]